MKTRGVIWRGRPSQLLNFWTFVFLFPTVIIPLVAWLRLRFTICELTRDRLLLREGILSRKTGQIELHRVRDYEIREPFVLRMFGKGDLVVHSRDMTTPVVVLRAISDPGRVSEIMRDLSEDARKRARVREAEVY